MMHKNRVRLVSFRLSEQEYENLESASALEGSSVASFARTAVIQRLALITTPQGLLSGDLSTLSARLNELNSSLDDIRHRISRVLGSSSE